MARRHRVSPAQLERKRKRRVIFFSLFMAFLMVASVASVILYNPTTGSQMEYGEYEFRLESRPDGGSALVTEIGGQPVEFQNLPIQVAYLSVDPAAITILRSASQIALVADPDLEVQDASIVDYARLQLGLAIPETVNAISAPDERYVLPVLNCSHASPQMPVLHFRVANASAEVVSEGYCITLTGRDRDLLRLKDRIIFEYHGILVNGQVPEQ